MVNDHDKADKKIWQSIEQFLCDRWGKIDTLHAARRPAVNNYSSFSMRPPCRDSGTKFSRRLWEPISFLKKNIDIAKLLYYYQAKSEGVIS